MTIRDQIEEAATLFITKHSRTPTTLYLGRNTRAELLASVEHLVVTYSPQPDGPAHEYYRGMRLMTVTAPDYIGLGL